MFSKKLPSSNSNRVVSHQKQLLLSGQISYVQIVQYYYIVPSGEANPLIKPLFLCWGNGLIRGTTVCKYILTNRNWQFWLNNLKKTFNCLMTSFFFYRHDITEKLLKVALNTIIPDFSFVLKMTIEFKFECSSNTVSFISTVD